MFQAIPCCNAVSSVRHDRFKSLLCNKIQGPNKILIEIRRVPSWSSARNIIIRANIIQGYYKELKRQIAVNAVPS